LFIFSSLVQTQRFRAYMKGTLFRTAVDIKALTTFLRTNQLVRGPKIDASFKMAVK